MKVYLATLVGIKDLDIKVFSQDQWEKILKSGIAQRHGIDAAVLDATDYIHCFGTLTPLLALARYEDIEVANEYVGVIY